VKSNPAVLTYHSQNIEGAHAPVNDHDALAADIEALHANGARIIPLGQLVDWLDGHCETVPEGCVCLTFDDGCDFDYLDLDWPGAGVQRSMLGIMQDFTNRHGRDAQPGMHATSFVIASPDARRLIDQHSLWGKDWIRDDWWSSASSSGMLSIASHGWDHNHPDLGAEGGFDTVNTQEKCEAQVIRAARYIESRIGVWPDMFAYPFGESSDYIREIFFPRHGSLHRCRAAFGTGQGPVHQDSDRWNLPRLVCGRDWQSPEELIRLLQSL
jgi:peptidoglycan/xylan/chitin deacetylase (PgdA/CDA1 family)